MTGTTACLFGCLAAAASAMAQTPPPKPRLEFPERPGKETVVRVCGPCHGAEVLVAKGRTRQEWTDVITSMVTRGAKGTTEEFAEVLNYLTVNFPPETAPAAQGR